MRLICMRRWVEYAWEYGFVLKYYSYEMPNGFFVVWPQWLRNQLKEKR